MIKLYSEQKKNKTLWPLFMDGRFKCLKASEPTTRRQFTFYHWVPRNSWYSFKRARKGERLSWPWTYPVVFNTGPLDWESSALTTRQLLHMKQDSNSFILIFDKVFHYIMLTCTQKLTEVIQILQSIFSASVNRLFFSEDVSVRSSRPDVFCKKGLLKKFAKFTGKHLYQNLF